MKEKSISNSITNFLKSFDYFAVTFEFRVDKKSRYGSKVGGFIFMLFMISSMAYFIKSLCDYLTFSETKIKFYEKSLDPGPELNYGEMNFSYAVQITLDDNTPIYNTKFSDLFTLNHTFIVSNLTNNQKIKTFSSNRKCRDKDFPDSLLNYPIFKRRKIDDFICFDFYKNFSLQGVFTNDIMKYSEILISINDKYLNSVDPNSENYKFIKKAFEGNNFKFTLYYIDSFNDISNLTKPVFYKIDAIYNYLDLNYFKRVNVFFQEFLFALDNNLFYMNYITNRFIKMFRIEEINSPVEYRLTSSIDRGYLSKFYLRSVNTQKVVHVSFIKLPEFLASLSGLLMNGLIFLNYILYYFNHFEAKQSIINKIMKYKDIIKSNNKKTLDYLCEQIVDENFKSRTSRAMSNASQINKSIHINDKLIPLSCNDSIEDIQNQNNVAIFQNHGINNYINNSDINNILHKNDSLFEKFFPKQNNQMEKNNKILNLKLNFAEEISFDIKKKNSNECISEKTINDNETQNNLDSSDLNLNQEREGSLQKKDKSFISKNPYGLVTIDICYKLLCCCFSSKKHKIFEKAESKFDHNIDMVNYMKKMQELDILKYLILDENTLQIMNFISKPCISMSTKGVEDEEYNLFFDYHDNNISLTNKNIDGVKKCYDNISKKSKRSVVEERILKLFELQILEILN